MWNLIKNIFENFPIISFFMYLSSNKKTEKFIQGISNWRIDEVDRSQLRKMLKIPFDRLETLNKQELERKEVIESKAKAKLTFISLGVTISFAGTTLLLTALPHDSIFVEYATIIKVLMGVSVLFLIQGGIAALSSMSFPYVYMGVIYKDLTKSCTAAASLRISKDILRNQYTNTQRSNYLDLTQKSVRNGLVVLSLLIFSILVVIKPNINDNDKVTKVQVENFDRTVNSFEKIAEKQESKFQLINKTLNNLVTEISDLNSKIEKPKENIIKK